MAEATTIPFERALPVGLLRAREAVMVHMRPILRAHGTTEQQWRVLRALNDVQPMDKTTLTNHAALLMPSLLRILKDLKQAGLIRLVRSQTNRRLTGVILTPRGAAYVAVVTAALAQKSIILKQVIGQDTVEQLLDLLRTVELRLSTIKTGSD
ncbi:MarR family transcriptional regulator [Bradyrhizobium cenepequi]|uniref:MarR family transcriptional regulator n=1 Tax=Bradyrhizobium cenepequi TaxID=2821403 RepID=UPI001CE2EC00|nr:homoprotocatechuate degradation operon regulator HpaR [Bradyrhizobium cenepequi]MCA6110574.1 homoprotocatechuate degradation operon regulator HpaR [Bradyrhizobium cenepequi]